MTKSDIKKEYSAGGIVYRHNSDGLRDWLLIQHAAARHWGFPKGHIGDKVKNESSEEAALREVLEEGAVHASIIYREPIIIEYDYHHGTERRHKTVKYYLMEYNSGDPEEHDDEVSEALFVPEDQIHTKITYDNDKEAFEKALLILQKSTS